MKKVLLPAMMAGTLLASGCASTGFDGGIYSDVRGPIQSTDNMGACPKSGTATAKSILGVYSSGDASIEAAKAAGGINKVISVDFHNKVLLGLIATTTVKVCGE